MISCKFRGLVVTLLIVFSLVAQTSINTFALILITRDTQITTTTSGERQADLQIQLNNPKNQTLNGKGEINQPEPTTNLTDQTPYTSLQRNSPNGTLDTNLNLGTPIRDDNGVNGDQTNGNCIQMGDNPQNFSNSDPLTMGNNQTTNPDPKNITVYPAPTQEEIQSIKKANEINQNPDYRKKRDACDSFIPDLQTATAEQWQGYQKCVDKVNKEFGKE